MIVRHPPDDGLALNKLCELNVAINEQFIDDQEIALQLIGRGLGNDQVMDCDSAIFNQSRAADTDIQMGKLIGQGLLNLPADLAVHARIKINADRHHDDCRQRSAELEKVPTGIDQPAKDGVNPELGLNVGRGAGCSTTSIRMLAARVSVIPYFGSGILDSRPKRGQGSLGQLLAVTHATHPLLNVPPPEIPR